MSPFFQIPNPAGPYYKEDEKGLGQAIKVIANNMPPPADLINGKETEFLFLAATSALFKSILRHSENARKSNLSLILKFIQKRMFQIDPNFEPLSKEPPKKVSCEMVDMTKKNV